MKTLKILPVVFGAWAVSVFASSVTINPEETHQTIRGFGGMVHNLWQGGKGLSEADAKLAFGTGDGELGLTVLRIPVNENSSNWNSDLAAAKLAKSYGAIVYATPWKPPASLQTAYTFTRWGTSYTSTQVIESNWQAYADHLNDFAAYMKNQGVPLYAISIQNEPDWCDSWTCWTADNLYKFTKNHAGELRKNGTKVISAESFAYSKSLYDQILNDADALKNIDIIGAHFYGSTASTANSYFEYALADQKATSQERWMTEHYTESQGSGNMWRGFISTGDQDQTAKLDTVRALDVGYEIHRGLVIGNFSLYTWWYIRRCYGLIMEKDFGGKLSIPDSEIGKPSKRGYVLSNFSRFVRPGAIRIGATANPEANVFVSAYKKQDSVVIVLINRDYGATKNIDISFAGANGISSFEKYVTSETKNLQKEASLTAQNGKFSVTLDKESITTLVGTVSRDTVPQTPFGGTAAQIPGKIEAENFDEGGAGNAYYDSDSENKGGAEIRPGESVDISEIATSEYALAYTVAGEWTEYTVNVRKAAEYALSVRYAAGGNGSGIRLFLDGEPLTDTVSLPQTKEDAWSEYAELAAGKVTLPAGEHVLKLLVTGSYANLDWIRFAEKGSESEATKIFRRGTRDASRLNVRAAQKSFDVRGRQTSAKNRYQVRFFK